MCQHAKLGINPNYFRFANGAQFTVDGISVDSERFCLHGESIMSLRGRQSFLQNVFALSLRPTYLKFGEPIYTSDDIAELNSRIKMVYKGITFPVFLVYPCNRCMECRSAKVSDMQSRCLLEAYVNPFVYFLTFTYDDEHLPDNGELRPDDLSAYFNSLRSHLRGCAEDDFHDLTFSWFACGEYGKDTFRPHYHCLLYFNHGVPRTKFNKFVATCLSVWKLGKIKDFQISRSGSAISRYCVKYVLKQQYLPDKIKSRLAEKQVQPFMRCSRKPAFGAGPKVLTLFKDAILHSKDGTIQINVDGLYCQRIKVPKILVDKVFEPLSRTHPNLCRKYFEYLTICEVMDDKLKWLKDFNKCIMKVDTPLISTSDYDPFLDALAFRRKYFYVYSFPRITIREYIKEFKDSIIDYSLEELRELAYNILVYFEGIPTLFQRLNSIEQKNEFYVSFIDTPVSVLSNFRRVKIQRLDCTMRKYDYSH